MLMYRFLQGCSVLILFDKEIAAVWKLLMVAEVEVGRRQRAEQGRNFACVQ